MKNATRIFLMLDRSASMAPIASETITSLNHFIEVLRTQPGECSLKLVQFDLLDDSMDYSIAYDAKLSEVPQLKAFTARGSNPLYDAMGMGITVFSGELGALPEQQRPSRVLFAAITNGADNASRRLMAPQLAYMIRYRSEQWKFAYLGANQEAVTEAAKLSIPDSCAISFESSNIGQAIASLATFINHFRSTGMASFTDRDRDLALRSPEPEPQVA